MIEAKRFRNLEFLRYGFGLVAEPGDADPGLAVMATLPTKASASRPHKSCNCKAAKKANCRHLRSLASLASEFRKATGGRDGGEAFVASSWHALGELLHRGETQPCLGVRVARADASATACVTFARGDGRELACWLDGSSARDRLLDRAGLSPKTEQETGRFAALKKLGLLIRSDTEQKMNAAGVRTQRQDREESFWGRFTYHCFREYGTHAGSFEPSIDRGSGEFTLTWRANAAGTAEPTLRLVVPRTEVRSVLKFLATTFPDERTIAIHPIPLKTLFVIAPTTELDQVEVRPMLQALQASGEQRFLERADVAKFSYGDDLVYVEELGVLAELERPDRPRRFIAPEAVKLARSQVPGFLSAHQDALADETLVLDESLRSLAIRREYDRIAIAPAEGNGDEPRWHWLSVRYGFGNVEIELRDLLTAKREGRAYLETDAGSIDLSAPSLRPLDRLLTRADLLDEGTTGGALRLSALELLGLTSSASSPIEVSKQGARAEIIRRLLACEPSVAAEALPELASPLRAYQRLGLEWLRFLYENGLSGLLCDDMGLGKTHQAMAFMLWLRAQRPADGPTLVVCPTTVISHWREKLVTHAPGLKVVIHHGSERDAQASLDGADVVVTSYGVVRNDVVELGRLPFALVVLDEAQHLKNRDTHAYRATRLLHTRMTLGLTGTPIENSLLDLKALFDLILPGYLGTDAEFERSYVAPANQSVPGLLPNPAVLETLHRKISPFILRRVKHAVLDELPEKIEDLRTCRLSDDQVKLYRDVLATRARPLVEQLQARGAARGPVPYLHIFAVLTLLKKICNHPALLLGRTDDADDERYRSGKWDLFQELLSESLDSGQKVVVFSQFLEMIAMIDRLLGRSGVGRAVLTGSSRDRGAIVRRFNEDPDCRVFIGSLKAGGTGIDLVAGSVVIHYDRWWNAAREDQATDRLHRIGQRRSVQVFKLVTEGTLEERISAIIERKRQVMQAAVREDDPERSKSFSREELLDLLGAV